MEKEKYYGNREFFLGIKIYTGVRRVWGVKICKAAA